MKRPPELAARSQAVSPSTSAVREKTIAMPVPSWNAFGRRRGDRLRQERIVLRLTDPQAGEADLLGPAAGGGHVANDAWFSRCVSS